MKIILISHLFPDETDGFGGISNLSRAKALKRAGNDVIIIKPVSVTPPIHYFFPLPDIKKITETIVRTIKTEKKNNYAGFPVYNLKWFPLPKRFLWWEQIYSFNLSVGTKVREIVKGYKPDAIITVVAHPEGTFARYLKKYCGCPVISIAEGSEILVYPKLYRGINKIAGCLNNYSDRVIFVSENMAENAAAKYNFSNWSIIQNGFESIIFNLSLRDPVRKQKSILSVGSLEHVKGHDLLLEAMKELPGWHLTIVGDGRFNKQYSKYIEDNTLSERIKIISYLSPRELKALYAESALFCMPSRSESFGISAIEALACGLPVISSGTGEMKKIIVNGVNGFILNELSSLCIEETLIKASKHQWDREKISDSVKGYSWDRWAKEMTNTLEGIMAGKTVNKTPKTVS
jgi:glycosyltransferase involved in cell wall biosynthesis